MKSNINIYIDQNFKDQLILIGKLNHWYRHGCDDSTLDENDLEFLTIVNEAHAMMIDIGNLNNKTTIISKIKELHGIKSNAQVQFILDVADALYNTQQANSKRYQRAMVNALLLEMINQCKKDKDHKALDRYLLQYTELNKLNSPDEDESTEFIEKVIEFTANAELLSSYDADNQKSIDESIAFYISNSKQKALG